MTYAMTNLTLRLSRPRDGKTHIYWRAGRWYVWFADGWCVPFKRWSSVLEALGGDRPAGAGD